MYTVTADLGMHELAKDFELEVWHCFDLVHKLLSAKEINKDTVQEIYEALENNGDLTKTWEEARKGILKKAFR